MKKWHFMAALTAVLIFFVIPGFAGGTMWVTSDKARLKSKPKASSTTFSTIPVGTEVSVLESKKRWYRVRTSFGKKGWMYRVNYLTRRPKRKQKNPTTCFRPCRAAASVPMRPRPPEVFAVCPKRLNSTRSSGERRRFIKKPWIRSWPFASRTRKWMSF